MKDFWAVKQQQQSDKHSMIINISLEFLAGCLHCTFVKINFFLLTSLKINTNQKLNLPVPHSAVGHPQQTSKF